MVERGTLPGQRVVVGDAGGRSPSVAGAGGRARAGDHGRRARWRRCASELAWFGVAAAGGADGGGHAGAGAGERAGGAAARAGRGVVEAPAIRIVPLERAGARISGGYDLVCLTSPNGVRAAVRAPARRPVCDARALAGARVAAIGPGTAAALREHGIDRRRRARAVRRRGAGGGAGRRAGARGRWWPGRPRRGTCCPTPCASAARGRRGGAVRDGGRAAGRGAAAPPWRAADYVTFTSSSTVRFFLESAGDCAAGARGWSASAR